MLLRVVDSDVQAVQLHRGTVVDCLRDADVSIRRRAVDLLFALINSSNVEQLAAVLLNHLVVADENAQPEICAKLADAVARFHPSDKWRIDTMLSMAALAGHATKVSFIPQLLHYITSAPEHHAYAVYKLYALAQETKEQPKLTELAVWCVGEYGQHLLQQPPASAGSTAVRLEPAAIIQFLDQVSRHHDSTQHLKAVVLAAAVKLSTRLDPDQHPRLRKVSLMALNHGRCRSVANVLCCMPWVLFSAAMGSASEY